MSPKRKKIALFGGSFNPPHIAHQLILFYLLHYRKFDAVHLIPAFKHPFNKALVSFEHRFAMCELLCKPFKGNVVADAIERELVTGGKSKGFTIDMVKEFTKVNSHVDCTLVVGADITHELDKWKYFDEIKTLVEVLIFTRPGYSPIWGYNYEVFDPPKISSSELRNRIATGTPVENFIYPPVLEYIRKTKLYI